MVINWSGIDRRSAAGRLLRAPLRLLPRNTQMTIRRGPAKGMKWIVGSSNHGCWLGTYEFAKQQALTKFLRPAMTVYDIGAQAGFYTPFFSASVGSEGRVYSFEPCPAESRRLIEHLTLNRVRNVRAILAAVSDRDGLVGLTTDRDLSMNSISAADESAVIVPALHLDALGFPPPELVKLDVEGAESLVLSGAQQILRRAMPVVFVALHTQEETKRCAMLLHDAGYRIFDLAGRLLEGAIDVDEVYAVHGG